MSYNILVSQVTNIRPHPNADRLDMATVRGCQVVIGKDSFKDGDLCLFMPTDGILSDAYCTANNLYPVFDKEGKRVGGGYFDPGKARVRAQKFRGEKSEGYVATLESVLFTGVKIEELTLDFAFCELRGIQIATKYETPATRAARALKQRSVKRGETLWFKKHTETEQLRHFIDSIPANVEIVLTEKTHGCVHADTQVETLNHGTLSIKEIVEKRLDAHIKSLNTQTNQIEYCPIGAYFFTPNDGEWYEIELEDGRKIIITGNNPVWLPELSCYRRVDELIGTEKLLVE